MYNRVIEIKERAEEQYYQTLQNELQPIVTGLVKDLQKLYPKRNIKIIFGNGECVVPFDNTDRMYNPIIDMYGNLNSFNEAGGKVNHRFFRFFDDTHPLIQLMKVLGELYDMKGYVIHLDDVL